jgi:protocatechuate 3,4-dioxygenase beta subunit
MSDENGTWSVTQLPPGDYIVSVSSPTHIFSTRGPGARGRGGAGVAGSARGLTATSQPGNVTVVADRVARPQIVAKRKAIISGRVVDPLGNPIADALVGAYDTWENDNLTDVRVVHTDAEGNFVMETGRGGSSIQVVGFNYALGYGTTVADSIVPGERRSGLQIQLSGTARISGTLLDPAGKGVEGITVTPSWMSYGGRTRTDARGRFDLGLVSVANTLGNYELRLTSAKPRAGRTIDAATGTVVNQKIDEAQIFYPDSVIPLDAPPLPGNNIDLKMTVKPTDLLIFRGRVLDAAGKPAPGTSF